MAEAARRSALEGAVAAGVSGRIGEAGPGVRIAERALPGLWQVAAWPDTMGVVAEALARAAGTAAPGPGRAAEAGEIALLRVEPLKWWLVGTGPAPALAPETGTVLDLSHARTVLRIEGRDAPALMSRLAPVDTRAAAFPEGRVASTAIHHVGVTLLSRAGAVEVFVPRSFARALLGEIAGAARQFGFETG